MVSTVDSQSSASRGLVAPQTMGVSSYKVSRRGTPSSWVVVVDSLQLHIQRPQVLLQVVLPHRFPTQILFLICGIHVYLTIYWSLLFGIHYSALVIAAADSESNLPVVAS